MLLNEAENMDGIKCLPEVKVGNIYVLTFLYLLDPVLKCTQQLCYTGSSGSETVLAVG